MSAGWISACVLALAGCDALGRDAPPPPSRYELAPAPPGARGAHAAGTESEPGRTPIAPRAPDPSNPEWSEPDPAPDADAGVDGGSEPEGVPL